MQIVSTIALRPEESKSGTRKNAFLQRDVFPIDRPKSVSEVEVLDMTVTFLSSSVMLLRALHIVQRKMLPKNLTSRTS